MLEFGGAVKSPSPRESLPMPAPAQKPRQPRAKATQERLLASAFALVTEQGFGEVRMTDITARAGCAVGTAYYLFGNRDGLFRAMKERFLEDMRARIGKLAGEPRLLTEPMEEVADAITEDLLAQLRANEGFLRAALTRAAEQPEEWRDFRTLVGEMRGGLVRALAPRLDAIAHPDPALALGFALQLVFSACVNAMLNDPGPLGLHDGAFERELKRMMRAYLGL